MDRFEGVFPIESISFKQLRLFESIGRLNSVRRASEECNLSQPAVTQALAKLEQIVGMRLVVRHASGSYLNENGQILHRRIARFTERFEGALLHFGVTGGAAGARSTANRLLRSQVRALIALVENGSIATAASRLDLSPATLQRCIRDLEYILHSPLLYRTASGPFATPEAIELGRRFKLSLQEIEWGVQELRESDGKTTTRLVIGAMPLGGNYLLASVLNDFLAREPQVEVVVRNESAAEMIKSLRAGDVDVIVGLIPTGDTAGLDTKALAQTPFSVVARANHPLAGRNVVDLDALAACEWLVGGPGSSRRTCYDQLFAGRPGLRTPIATSALPIIRELLLTSNRLTLMTSFEFRFEGAGLAPVAHGLLEIQPTIGLTMRSDWLPTRQHSVLIDMLRDSMEAMSRHDTTTTKWLTIKDRAA